MTGFTFYYTVLKKCITNTTIWKKNDELEYIIKIGRVSNKLLKLLEK